MVSCFVPHCGHSSDSNSPCKLFRRFPADKKLRQKWISLVRRADRLPSEWSCVCSCHFIGENKLKTKVPSLFPWNVKKYFQYEWPEMRTRKKRSSAMERQCAAVPKNVSEEVEVVYEIPDPLKTEEEDFNTVQDPQFFNNENVVTSVYIPESNVPYVPETNKPVEKLTVQRLSNVINVRTKPEVIDASVQTWLTFLPKQYVSHPAFYESQIYHLEKEIKELKDENTRLKKENQKQRVIVVPNKALTLK